MITPEYIKEYVQKYVGIDDLDSKKKARPYPYYRFICYKLCKDFCYPIKSLTSIAKAFNRDHATVIYGLKTFDSFSNQSWFEIYFEIYKNIHNQISNHIKIKKNKTYFKTEPQNLNILNDLESIKECKKILDNLILTLEKINQRPIFKEIAGLDNEALDEFEQKAIEFMVMNRNKIKESIDD